MDLSQERLNRILDPRLIAMKGWRRAMKSYVLLLYEFVREMKPEYVLEIGVQNGQSTKSMVLAMGVTKVGKLVSIDRRDRSKILDDEFSDVKKYWIPIAGYSQQPETVKAAKNAIPKGTMYDLFLIDGDHTYEGVKADWELYTPMVKPGGVILLHDTVNKNAGVKDFWPEIDWEKFNITWGFTQKNPSVKPGLGIVRKPEEPFLKSKLVDDSDEQPFN